MYPCNEVGSWHVEASACYCNPTDIVVSWPECLGHRWRDRAPANLAKVTSSVRDRCLKVLIVHMQKTCRSSGVCEDAGSPDYASEDTASPLHLVKGGRSDTLPWEANTVLDQASVQTVHDII